LWILGGMLGALGSFWIISVFMTHTAIQEALFLANSSRILCHVHCMD
jgi:hypothetical protein